MDLETLMGRLGGAPGRADSLLHLEMTPPRAAKDATWPDWLGDPVREAFQGIGVPNPWSHQRAAADLVHSGQHTVISTGTASGKSLCYLLPGLQAIESARGPKGQRGASVLYLAPTKALAQDQLAALQRLGLPDLRCSTHDGDSPPELRLWTRDHAEYVLTNPDMLHHSLLPGHARWSRFFASLRYVVVDECHHYRGVFGAHVAQILRRLRRVAALYGAQPDVRAGLRHRRRAAGLRRPAHRARCRRRHRRRFAPGPHRPRAVGAAVRARGRGERRSGPPVRHQ